ncbi:hypothetical protein Niako_6663 [Niastella koreensis GR20-10]|uniref:Uncharacterized protein n=1 Tax=Niastella koreensis (strain DSM 17620 / KACC 11465 / NBRC 106392 / GR20-10) TaxID=700598 RepID=G8TIN4_NIAKG|nr:hypothetical protein Niako_6663 [Niastella koreensis GR20-10]
MVGYLNNSQALNYNSFYNPSPSKTFAPVARYAEVLLINTEANVAMNALYSNYINQLFMFCGQSTVTFTNQAQAMDIVRTAWKNEFKTQVTDFMLIKKLLSTKGVFFGGFFFANSV